MTLSALAAIARLTPALALGLALGLAAAAGATEPGVPDPGPATPVEELAPVGAPPPSADVLLFEAEYAELATPDPLERSNRVFFRGNEVIYEFVFDPLANAYAFVVPGPVRRSLVRFFENLGEPADCLNELLQLNPRLAGRTGARFVVNSTVGLVGLLDPADGLGLPARSTDFGETLGAYGVGEGWFLIVPFLGPSTVRDLFGDVVDSFFQPQSYFLGYTTQLLIGAGNGFSRYEAERDNLDALRQSSLDFYSALRSAYRMQRAASVREARADSPVLRRLGWDDGAPAAVAAPAPASD